MSGVRVASRSKVGRPVCGVELIHDVACGTRYNIQLGEML